MYFLDLQSFHPNKGINTNNHNKYPFLESTDGLFEPDDVEFNFDRNFPFVRIELNANQPFYVSEPNLLKVFKNTAGEDYKILVNNIKPIEEVYIKQLAELFYDGYSAGMVQFYKEIGQTYLSLDLVQKKQVLRNFITYCHTNLYFEGFAIPEVLFALGYIQASLVKGFQEYSNIRGLEEKEVRLPRVSADPIDKVSDPEVKPQPSPEVRVEREKDAYSTPFAETEVATIHLPLRYPASEIFDLWCALLDSHLCQQIMVPQVFHTEEEIKELLGSLFKVDGKEPIWPISRDSHYYEMAQGYQKLLCLLMHATYKLNDTYIKISQIKYCELLKSSFSPFNTIESAFDIKGNMTKKKDSVIEPVQRSAGERAKKAYQILKKIPSYRLKD